jgi:exonuclease III
MIKCIQINLNCCKAAQALLHQVAAEKSTNFIFLSEPNRNEDTNWHTDTTGKATIVNANRIRLDNEGTGEAGFRWVTAHGIRLYSCYWSPNSTFTDYMDFLNRLEQSIRSERSEAIITGDFNAKHTDWGSPKSENRGEALADLINALGLIICNKGNSSTFYKGSIIDLTIATPNLASKVLGWKVLKEESLSDHFYITFDVHLGNANKNTHKPRPPKIDLKKLESALVSDRFNQISTRNNTERCALALTEAIHECRIVAPSSS